MNTAIYIVCLAILGFIGGYFTGPVLSHLRACLFDK